MAGREFSLDEIANQNLKASDIPSSPASWDQIKRFAGSFNAYTAAEADRYWRLASQTRMDFLEGKKLALDGFGLSELRTIVFLNWRAMRQALLKVQMLETTKSGIICVLLGHSVDWIRWHSGCAYCRRCATPILSTREVDTRIGHTVSCFLFGHSYHPTGTREGHNEYVCSRCGHPLLLVIACDPYRECSVFTKKVRYLCNLFGHKVHQVTNRSSFAEYACDCGHSFLKRRTGMVMVNHPLVCLLAGHFVQFVEMRNGHAEFLCRNCGHTFCFEEKR